MKFRAAVLASGLAFLPFMRSEIGNVVLRKNEDLAVVVICINNLTVSMHIAHIYQAIDDVGRSILELKPFRVKHAFKLLMELHKLSSELGTIPEYMQMRG